MHVVEDPARRLRVSHLDERAVLRERVALLALVDRAGSVIDVAQARVVVDVAAIGDDLGRADDQLAGVLRLEVADLVPVPVGHVVRQRDEVETGVVERVIEHFAHRRVVGVRVTRVHVEVARVPSRVRVHHRVVVGRRNPRLVGVGRVGVGEDLQSPLDGAVQVPFGQAADRREADLRRPLAGRDRTRLEADGRRVLRRDENVRPARAAPPAELVLVVEKVTVFPRLVDAEIERVLDRVGHARQRKRQLGLVVADLHADARRAGRDVERHEHVRALE